VKKIIQVGKTFAKEIRDGLAENVQPRFDSIYGEPPTDVTFLTLTFLFTSLLLSFSSLSSSFFQPKTNNQTTIFS